MTGDSPRRTVPPLEFADLVDVLRDATGQDERWAAGINPATRLDADLYLDSLELAAAGELLRGRYGERVDLTGFVAGLDLVQIIELTAGDVLAYLVDRLGEAG